MINHKRINNSQNGYYFYLKLFFKYKLNTKNTNLNNFLDCCKNIRSNYYLKFLNVKL